MVCLFGFAVRRIAENNAGKAGKCVCSLLFTPFDEHFVDQAVLFRFGCGHPVVAVGIFSIFDVDVECEARIS